MSPQRRTALLSVVVAALLLAIKLTAGLASGSLGLVSEALHSGTDLVAAALTFFAIGVAGRPADRSHPYGHGKAEHLAALAEAGVLALVSLLVAGLAAARLGGALDHDIHVAWWAFAVIGVVIVLDLSRTVASYRASRLYGSPALLSNALHFGSDLAGTIAVLGGLVAASQGFPQGDSIAALFVAALVLVAATRLIRRNVDVLMDRAPAAAELAAREAIAGVEPPVHVSRLRLRQAAGRTFADVVISVPSDAAVGQGHAAADEVEAAVERVLPGSDVVVHVEPGAGADAAVRERAHAAALSVPRVREVHNLSLVEVAGTTELSLHLKLPGELRLDDAHEVAEQVEQAIMAAAPEIHAVQTHLEPLTEASEAVELEPGEVERIVRASGGTGPRQVRVLRTDEGVVVFVTLGLDRTATLADAHGRASEVEERLRREHPEIADVIVHTEP
ncbi:MAG TPA: cation diffusion facilitator family transporter [Gaiellaceae bacterium]|jgi:cation diffusion facilitator family transporter|nr:cation diffusion facilitator family transporter [Gaiellaceae bacterium]